MDFTVSINMDNSAFDEGNNGYEVARILENIALRLKGMWLKEGSGFPLMDANGNTVGRCEVAKDKYDE